MVAIHTDLMKKKLTGIVISSKIFSRCLSLVNIVDRCDKTIVACWKMPVVFNVQSHDLFIHAFFCNVEKRRVRRKRERETKRKKTIFNKTDFMKGKHITKV